MTPPVSSPQAYRENTVLSATPEQLVVMLYDGAQRFLRRAGAEMRAGEIEATHNDLRRAEAILAHLNTVLDHEHDPQLAGQLSAIYRFCLEHLNRARFQQTTEELDEVVAMLGELRESWAELARR